MKPQITETEFKTIVSRLRFVESINRVLHEIATVRSSQSTEAKEPEPTLTPSKNRDYKVRKKSLVPSSRAVTNLSIDFREVDINHDTVSHRCQEIIDPVIVDAFEEFLISLKGRLLSSASFEVVPDPQLVAVESEPDKKSVLSRMIEDGCDDDEDEFEDEDEEDDDDDDEDEMMA